MKKHILSAVLVLVGLMTAISAAADNGARKVITLNDGWAIKAHTSNKKSAELTPVTLPHTWNAEYLPGTINYNREMMVYKRKLQKTADMEGKRIFLLFEGVNSVADVFVNYRTAIHHEGGYTAFSNEITELLNEGENDIEVWVSNAYRTDVLPISGDFNIYGGIHRPVHMIITEENCINPTFYASPGVLVRQNKVTDTEADFTVETLLSLKGKKNGLTVKSTLLDADGKEVAKRESGVAGERVYHQFKLSNLTLWNGKQNPYLYTVKVGLYDGDRLIDEVSEQTGFRYFHADADKGFFLNGKPLDLVGFNRHEDFIHRGSALLQEHYDRDMELINELGATCIRLAHYPHGSKMYEAADKNGIILWTEIPLCGPGGYAYTGFLNNEGLKDNARQVLHELVYQNYNHPSIFFWGIFNELLLSDGDFFQEYDNPVEFVRELGQLYKQLDPSRLTTFATCVDQVPYIGTADLIAWNKYWGWKSSEESAGKFFDEMHKTSQGYPVGVSEYGAGGSPLQHADIYDRDTKQPSGYHPEEHQAACHEGYWSAFVDRPYLWATLIWQFSDMQSSIRREGDTHGRNDKGCVTYDRKTKKDIFYFYKSNWNPEPMLHLCSKRYTERTNANAQVKVYTTLKDATLYVNGKKVSKQKPDRIHRVIWDNIQLQQGTNTIKVTGKQGKQLFEEEAIWTLVTKD